MFLVSVPFGLFGTVWAYMMLRETALIQGLPRIDWAGNVSFAAGLTLLLLGTTYGIQPYGGSTMGWTNPLVIAALAAGVLLLVLFIWIDLRVSDPMFRLSLFKIRMFTAGNISGFLVSVARGGLQFMLIIWLQGIWLPLHGYSFEDTPLWAGIYMLPLLIGFVIMGPLSGYLSDRFGARLFSTLGMAIQAVGFVILTFFPANFDYSGFAILLFALGIGQGMFAAPNTTAIINAVPAHQRGVASGMRATFQNGASVISLSIFFSIVIIGLAGSLPETLLTGLTQAGLPRQVARGVADLPPTAANSAAFLGYNPMQTLLPAQVLAALPQDARATLLGHSFFPDLISRPFMDGLHTVFYLSAALCLISAVASLLRGARYIHEDVVPAPAGSGARSRPHRQNAE